MTDAVQIALINAIPAYLTSAGVLAGIYLTYRNGRKSDRVIDKVDDIGGKVNGINAHLQGKLDRQSEVIVELANGTKK